MPLKEKGVRSQLSNTKNKQTQEYPEVIKALPEADMPFPGVKAWILQASNHQLIFFEMQTTALVPEHSHTYPQWGMVITGKMRLTIDSKTRTVTNGQEYLIPAGAKHKATFQTTTRVMDLFSEKNRYEAKTTKNRPQRRSSTRPSCNQPSNE